MSHEDIELGTPLASIRKYTTILAYRAQSPQGFIVSQQYLPCAYVNCRISACRVGSEASAARENIVVLLNILQKADGDVQKCSGYFCPQ